MPNQFTILLLLILPFIISPIPQFIRVAEASNRRVHITDDLDDVVDDEEDDAWKQWGKKSTPSPELDLRPSDLSAMSAPEIQAEMMKRHSGPAFGFIKLRPGVRRSRVMKSLVLDWIEAEMWTGFVILWVIIYGFWFILVIVCFVWAAIENDYGESNWIFPCIGRSIFVTGLKVWEFSSQLVDWDFDMKLDSYLVSFFIY